MKPKEIKELSCLAQNILNNNTGYYKNKIIIKDLFDNSEDIALRLRVVDSMYSTSISRRLFGFDDLEKKIKKTFGNCSDQEAKDEINNYLNNNNSDRIDSLFRSTYGMNKLCTIKKKATSVISKYLYFMNDFEFPIFDKLVKNSYEFFEGNKLDEANYLKKLRDFKEDNKIDTYDKLDNMLWLVGKIKKGSLSLIIDRDNYVDLIDTIGRDYFKPANNEEKGKLKSEEIDGIISCYMQKSNNLSNLEEKRILSSDLVCFIKKILPSCTKQ